MRRFKITYGYDGSGFKGSQKQPGIRTVQGEIERVLAKIDTEPIALVPSGRTDTSVHAINQVGHFDVSRENIGPENFLYMFKRQLPQDIIVSKVEEVDLTFHARFDATSKQYVYKLMSLAQTEKTPFTTRYYTFINESIDIEALNDILTCYVGTHDFTSFTVTPRRQKTIDNTRTIYQMYCAYNETEECYDIYIKGDGFLQYMIRIMVAFALDVLSGKEEKGTIGQLFETKDIHYVNSKLEPYGLYLQDIFYNG